MQETSSSERHNGFQTESPQHHSPYMYATYTTCNNNNNNNNNINNNSSNNKNQVWQ